MPTRVVHRVRCRHKSNSQIWADVKVVDAISIIAPNGQEMVYFAKAKEAIPFIRDDTGDGNGVGDPSSCTRASHMVQVSSAEDDKQVMDVEVLDALAFLPPNWTEPDSAPNNDQGTDRGVDKAARFGKGPFVMTMPDNQAVKLIVDKTGLGLGGGGNGSSRSGHISLVTDKGNTDDGTDGVAAQGDSVPPQKMPWLAVLKTDAISFQGPGTPFTVVIPKRDADELDTTQETTDPVTHDPCPPDNTDPNHYVMFPDKAAGASVKIPNQPGGAGPISQGPLWWIEKISPIFRPWFWFANVNTPLAFSFFGPPGNSGSWPWRGFMIWNFFPVVWILSRNNPLFPMGQFGSTSLELCAEKGSWDSSYPPTPSNPFLAQTSPPHVVFPFTGLAFVPPELQGDPSEAPPPTFGPFGGLPMTQPPLEGPLNGGLPNVWQLTGRQQPPLKDPSKKWQPFTNPYTPPSRRDAEDLALDYRARWNASSNGHNQHIQGWVPTGGPRHGYGTAPPGWAWEVPYYDFGIPANRFAFQNGIPASIGHEGIPLATYVPASTWTLDVGQLDPKTWDDTHLEYFNNPINAFVPFVLPPFKWDNDPWIGTNHNE